MPLLHLDYEYQDSTDWHSFLEQFDIKVKAQQDNLVFSSYQVCLSVAEQGHGVALGWARSVNHKLAEGKLIRLSKLSSAVTDGVVVYEKKKMKGHPITDEVVHIIESSLKPVNLAKTSDNQSQ